MKSIWNYDNLKKYVEENSECKFNNFYRNKVSHIILNLQCKCGNDFEVEKKHFDKGKNKCNKCNGVTNWNEINLKEYVINNSKCEFIDFYRDRKTNKTNIMLNLKCECGETFVVEKGAFDKGQRQCKSCSGFSDNYGKSLGVLCEDSLVLWDYEKNYPLTPYDITYNSSKKYWFKCSKNKHESFKQIVSVFYSGGRCNLCSQEEKESNMATILKQVFKYYYPNTIWEARLGAKYKNELPYDIYIPELNLVIECQSEYHDVLSQIKKDKIKKEYAIKNGYQYIEIDCRDYTPLQAIQKFFPHIDSLPKYIDLNLNTMIPWDIEIAQQLLNETNLTYKEISEKINTTEGAIMSSIVRGVLYKNPERKTKKGQKNRRKIRQLSLNGEMMKTYNSIRDAEKETGCDNRNISACCRGKIKTVGGFKWEYIA